MRRLPPCIFLAAFCFFLSAWVSAQQLQRRIETEKGETRDALAEHPLSWWTRDPLRFDTSGDLMLGFKAPDGESITKEDYRTEEEVTTLGVVAGHKIVQILTTIHPGPRVIAAGFASQDDAGEWKDLLVGSGGEKFVEIYALHFDGGGLVTETAAKLYGSGANAVLGTYDPDTGNGGGCWDGYWWFDQQGPHEVDFSPLEHAIEHAIPANTSFTLRCWALKPESSELQSGVQRKDAECHACGMLGEVHATYRFERGTFEPVSISFDPETQ